MNPSLTPILVAATYAIMVSIGAINASYGAVLPWLEAVFGVSSAVIGFLGTAQTIGGVLGNLSAVPLESRLSVGKQMWLGATVLALGCLSFALALFAKLGFILALISLFLMGWGLGLFQVNYANLFSKGFGVRSGAVMSVMSTAFAVGSIAGPSLAVWLSGFYAWLPVAFGVLSLICSSLVRQAVSLTSHSEQKKENTITPQTWLFAIMVALYVVAEQGAGFWGITHLRFLELSEQDAAGVFSLFWLLILLGRLAGAGLAVRFSSQSIVLFCSIGASLAFFLAMFPSMATWAYWIAGVLLAPIFPLGLTWLAKHNPSSLATTIFLVSGSLGAALGIPLVGLLKNIFAAGVIPLVLGLASAGSSLMVLLLLARTSTLDGKLKP